MQHELLLRHYSSIALGLPFALLGERTSRASSLWLHDELLTSVVAATDFNVRAKKLLLSCWRAKYLGGNLKLPSPPLTAATSAELSSIFPPWLASNWKLGARKVRASLLEEINFFFLSLVNQNYKKFC